MIEPNTATGDTPSHSAVPSGVAAGPEPDIFDVVVVGGGPCGATAADDLARAGYEVALLDRAGRIKPCGGAIPPRLISDFAIPDELIVARIKSARIVSPSDRHVDMPIDGGYVGMVDRDVFDEWLRARAEGSGAIRHTGTFSRIERDGSGLAEVIYTPKRRTAGDGDGGDNGDEIDGAGPEVRIKTRMVIGADGARSKLGKQEVPKAEKVKCVFAYHEIIARPENDD
ncbi:MAG: FAD-dependent monooxygenase, partial [Pseudomonadota bacterium]